MTNNLDKKEQLRGRGNPIRGGRYADVDEFANIDKKSMWRNYYNPDKICALKQKCGYLKKTRLNKEVTALRGKQFALTRSAKWL